MKIAFTYISLVHLLAAERHRAMLWSPLGVMLGIGAYFYTDSEPPVWLGVGMVGGCALMLAVLWRRPWRWVAMPFLLFALGFGAAQWRAHRVATPLLTQSYEFTEVEGTIDEVEPVEKRIKLVLSHPVIEGLAAERTPLRLRVSFRDDGSAWQVGDRVRMRGTLYPLPGQVMPGSYDFARHFYFRSIGGNGFAMRTPEVVQKAARSDGMDWLNNLRHAIGEDMRAHMPGPTGAVAAAMTVGETGPIPPREKALLRDAGLAHMLAIAGLHLGIVAGIVFFNVRLLLTLWPGFALRMPVKKIAAALALVSALIYLMLAGRPIPAQRAFIMVAFLFTAVMLDRRGITLRTLAISAMFILLAFPETMFGASFQMSFAATLAIVSLFETAGRHLHGGGGFWHKVRAHAVGIVATSLVATLATAPFVLYNFNRFALFGLIANMAVIPLATFVIMPGVVLSLLLMPLGLQWIGYVPLRYGTEVMMWMAAWVTGLPYSALHLVAPSDAGLGLAAVGLMWLCLMTQRWRWAGVPVMALGLATLGLHASPDVLISHDARQVMVRAEDGHYTMIKGSKRSFTVQNWLRAEGEDELTPLGDTQVQCDDDSCAYQRHGHRLVFVQPWAENDVVEGLCRQKMDVLVAWRYLQDCSGAARLVGRRELETYGAQALWFGEAVRSEYARQPGQDQRLWQVKLAED